MATVSERIARVIGQNANEVFALMGNGNAYLTDALSREDVRLTAVRHEAATVASADSYYRISRKLAVATTTYGPGFTNAITPLAEAAQARTPMLVVVGDAPTSGPRPWDINQSMLATSVGVETLIASQGDAAVKTLKAIELALKNRKPVILAIPYDLASAESTEQLEVGVANFSPENPEFNVSAVDAVATLIAKAQRPLILAGRGARWAQHQLHSLADKIGALTVTTAPARGMFSGRSYDLGVCGGFASESSARLIRAADLVLVVGAGLNQFTSSFGHAFSEAAEIVQVDILPQATSEQVTTYISADAVQFAESLLERTDQCSGLPWQGMGEEAKESKTHLDRDPGVEFAADGRLDPRSVMVRLNEILPPSRQLVSDGGHFIGWANTYLDIKKTDGITLVGTIFQSIGLGIPSAAGAARACPEETIVVATGDGGGIMGIADLDTLVRTAQSAIVLVFNDAGYGAEVHQYGSQGLSEVIMHIEQIDFANIAQGVGAQGLVVEKLADLAELDRWVLAGAKGTIVVDLRISQLVRAPYIQEIIDLTIKK